MKTILVDAVNSFIVPSEDGSYIIFEPLRVLLDNYPNRKIILTGANDEQYQQFGLDKMPYEVFTLKHNPEKSDPAYYRSFLQNYGLDAGSVIYFEHNPNAVESARTIGIPTFYWDKEIKPIKELELFLKQNINT